MCPKKISVGCRHQHIKFFPYCLYRDIGKINMAVEGFEDRSTAVINQANKLNNTNKKRYL